MTPKYKHRDFEIEFDVVSEEWKCGSLALSDKSLSKLKKVIDREGKKRRTVNVEVLYLHEGYRGRSYIYMVKAAIVVLLREGDRKADIKINGEKHQEQVDIGDLYPLSERKKLDAFIAAKKREEEAQGKAAAAQEVLEPLTAKAIREAVVRSAEGAT